MIIIQKSYTAIKQPVNETTINIKMPAVNRHLLLLWALRRRIQLRKMKANNNNNNNNDGRRKSRRKHRWWVRPTLLNRDTQSQFHTILPVMREHDREWYFQ